MGTRRSHRRLLALGSLLITLVAVEMALRVWSALSWQSSIEELHRNPELPPAGRRAKLGDMLRPSPHERLVYELKPGLDVRFRNVPVRTNSRGWREGAVEASPPSGTRRILGIGDSTMFGWGVVEEARYMDLLEERLNADGGSPVRWESVVTAVPGYNLMMELESLRRFGLELEPDLIVYGWDRNDLCLPNFLVARKGLFESGSLLLEALRGAGSKLPGLRSRARLRVRCQGEAPERYRPVSGREAFEQALEELASISTELDVPVVVLGAFDLDFESAMALPLPPPLLYADPVPRAKQFTEKDLSLRSRDPHANELGHRLLAETLYAELGTHGVWEDLSR